MVFVVGPSIVAALTVVADPGVAMIVAAVASVTGCVLVAASPHTTPGPRREHHKGHWLGPLRFVPVLGVLPIGFLLMGSIVVIEVSLVAFAEHSGTPALAVLGLVPAGEVNQELVHVALGGADERRQCPAVAGTGREGQRGHLRITIRSGVPHMGR